MMNIIIDAVLQKCNVKLNFWKMSSECYNFKQLR